MFTNRLFTLFVAAALIATTALTVREAIATNAVIAHHSYDLIEHVRLSGHPVSKFEVNTGYDWIEQLRADRTRIGSKAKRSYDQIEQVRLGWAFHANRFYDPIETLRTSREVPSMTANSGYELVEQLRVGRGLKDDYAMIEALRIQNMDPAFARASGYDLVEEIRLTRHVVAEHSYDSIEAIRLQR